MEDIKTFELNGHILEFIPEIHRYIVDGELVPCVSNILAYRFNDYVGISREFLNRAAELGTNLHRAIELYEKEGQVSDLKEFKNYLFLKKRYKFKNIANEIPVIYEEGGKVLYTGTLDQVLEIDAETGLNDFKRVSNPNKEKIAIQLNLYKLGYEQTYHKKVDFLMFTHLREDVRKVHKIPINEKLALDLVYEYLEKEKENGR